MPEQAPVKTKAKVQNTSPTVTKTESPSSASADGILPSIGVQMGGDFSGATFDHHVALLGDPRMSQPMYDQHRIAIVQRLQSDYGNGYVQRLVDHIQRKRSEGVQTRLTVGPAGDSYEREADAVAREVMKGIGSSESGEERVRNETRARAHRLLQRHQEAVTAQRRSSQEQPQVGKEGGEATPEVSSMIERSRGGGQTLPDSVRTQMERGFGADFGGVRVHTGPNSDELNRALSARAFTTGQDIFFKNGEYAPGSHSGKETIAHELTHVVQQNGAQRAADTELPEEELQLKPVQRPTGLEGGDVDPEVAPSIQQTQRRGQDPSDSIHTSMKGAFGADFGNVDLQRDEDAMQQNEEISGQAFTQGPRLRNGGGLVQRDVITPGWALRDGQTKYDAADKIEIPKVVFSQGRGSYQIKVNDEFAGWLTADEFQLFFVEAKSEATGSAQQAEKASPDQPSQVGKKKPSVPTSKPLEKNDQNPPKAHEPEKDEAPEVTNEPSAEPTPTAQPKDYGDPFLNQLYELLIQIKNPAGALDEGKRKIGWKIAWRKVESGYDNSLMESMFFDALGDDHGEEPNDWEAAMKPEVEKAAARREVLLEGLNKAGAQFETKNEVDEFIKSCRELVWLGNSFDASAGIKFKELNAEMLKGHGLDKSDEPGKGLEPQLPLMNREGREQDALGTAAIQVHLMGEELDTKAVTEPAPQSKGDWDYFYAADLVDQLEDKLGEANEQLTAARDPKGDDLLIAASNPDVLYPRAEKAIHGTARRLKGIVEGKYPNRLKVYAKLIASGVAAAVKTAIAIGALELGKLVKGKHLGKGASGEVWEYSYLEMKQKIAGKETLGTDIENENVQEALKAESDLQSALPESRNLLAGLGDVEAKGRTIAFMELAGGGDVKAVIEEMNKPEHGFGLAEKDLIMRYILKGTLEGLEALHKFGMVHGDIKPGNIFLDENLNPVLADFGESHMQGRGTGGVGTVKYMAPEVQYELGSFRASDIWAVGEMLLLALTGRNSIRYILGTDVKYLENEEFRKGDITDEELAAKLDEDHSESGITEAIASFAKGALTKDQGERMTATEGLAHQLLQDVDDEGAKRLIRQLLDAIAGRKLV